MEHTRDLQKYMSSFFGEEFFAQFQGIFNDKYPPVNLYKTENEILCLFSVPGLTSIKDIEAVTDYRTLDIRGKVEYAYPGFHLYHDELFQGYFERTIELPYPVRSDRVKATYHNGLLIVQLYRRINGQKEKTPVEILEKEDD
ncbi:Hsp20/alpha crystallin family protein [Bacillus marinisedimentorum]|uniref:Hsp20/alpha crystallin family protein n=1 Tax=Bacillus marinisedimentorum TaxID=1821260 RepID=UPI00147145BA|nr:Hsp20/alpha crystallin family protein [Bacillus marinisedimentorum]